ncbi:MAG: dihydrodipicolinate synthase family protein [Planctomycetota bacterium]
MRSNELHGVWVALPTAWDENENFDAKTYQADIEYLCTTGIHGIYSGGTTGEFYNQDFDDFTAINSVLLKTTSKMNVPAQVGATALSTKEVAKRMEWAVDNGAKGFQIALPYWLKMGDDEVLTFFEDISRVAANAYIIHYDTMRSKRSISPDLYKKIRQNVPNLVGSKLASDRIDSMKPCLKEMPNFTIFVGEAELYDGIKAGVKGTYSSLVMTNPAYMLDYYNACCNNDDEKALAMKNRIVKFFDEAIDIYIQQGYWDSALDRLQASLNPNLNCGLACRKPYKFFTQEILDKTKQWLKDNDPDLLLHT